MRKEEAATAVARIRAVARGLSRRLETEGGRAQSATRSVRHQAGRTPCVEVRRPLSYPVRVPGYELDDLGLFDGNPLLTRRLEICNRLYAIAPEVMYWRRADPKTRGPHPTLPQEHRAEVLQLLTEWAALEGQEPG